MEQVTNATVTARPEGGRDEVRVAGGGNEVEKARTWRTVGRWYMSRDDKSIKPKTKRKQCLFPASSTYGK
jgi:hypothetical protein